MGKGKPRHVGVTLTVRTPTGIVVDVSPSVAHTIMAKHPGTWGNAAILARTVTYADGTTRTTTETEH